MQEFNQQEAGTAPTNPPAQAQVPFSNYEQAYVEQERPILENKLQSGANWFFWIAGLSLINSLIILLGGKWSFILGLGATQMIDGFSIAFAGEGNVSGRIVAFLSDLIVASVFVLFGILGKKKMTWALVVGMILYALDALIFIFVGDILAIAFHAYALYCLFGGLRACLQLNTMEKPY